MRSIILFDINTNFVFDLFKKSLNIDMKLFYYTQKKKLFLILIK